MHRSPKQIIDEAKRTGTVWLGGEMEFPLSYSHAEALARLRRTAEQVGGLVGARGTSAITVHVDPYDGGYYTLDWFRPDAKSVVKIERWDSVAAYTSE